MPVGELVGCLSEKMGDVLGRSFLESFGVVGEEREMTNDLLD